MTGPFAVRRGRCRQPAAALPLDQIRPDGAARLKTGLGELDRVLGGGLVKGSVVLLGGDPGIGKSTLLLQVCDALGTHGPALYATGEESAAQIRLRAQRLGIQELVTFAGKVPHEQMPPYLAMGDFYITASTSDTNSISMLEGMCSGLPVLQRTDPLNADQVVDGENGFNFNTPREMGDKLRRIQTMDPDTLAQFKHSVIESIRNSGAKDLAARTLAVYQRVLRR